MVAEAWIVRMGNQVSTNLKQAFLLEPSTNSKPKIGILSNEVANLMSRTIHLHTSLSPPSISALQNHISNSQGLQFLVSSHPSHLLELLLAEKLHELNHIASVVSRWGKKCRDPALQGFEHVYGDLVRGAIDVKEVGFFLVKHMEAMVRKMDRHVNATKRLFTEMEAMNELEQSVKKFQHSQHKLMWQKQQVKHLKEISLWNLSYDKAVELLARTVCTIYARISLIFCGSTFKPQKETAKGELASFRPEDFGFPGRIVMGCLSLSSSVPKLDDVIDREEQYSQISSGLENNGLLSNVQNGVFKRRLKDFAPPSTLGGSALALHYANVIIVIEKLLRYPHLVGEEARDDLYRMLPTSLRLSLRTKLKSYGKSLGICDAPVAHEWKESVDGILGWLAPLAHDMIRWQSERNFEQHRMVSRSNNVLLLQTLYFADRKKTEEAVCELLVGLNYICCYEHQQSALLDCASSFDFEDCRE